ncbi:hypothetical protein AVEN_92303-1 [Araneus ventricosus]|uniref:Uncharacterized protein n=1 Tax=Araneus ventricosus TaxID=182803 RepID=A0A4Y2AN34_ARAVE|nr:hypothetical protein AVEN_92303-1 [Araneus ventricosus]
MDIVLKQAKLCSYNNDEHYSKQPHLTNGTANDSDVFNVHQACVYGRSSAESSHESATLRTRRPDFVSRPLRLSINLQTNGKEIS